MKLKVFRYDPAEDEEARYEEYEIPMREEHMKVIDALNLINSSQSAGIAFRSSCRAGQCGSCAVRVNKVPRLACRTDVEEGMVLEPLRNFPVLKDLVVASERRYPRMGTLRPYLHRGSRVQDTLEPIKPEALERISKLKDCILCFSCMSICPVLSKTREFSGPMLFRTIARFLHDPRERLERLPIAVEEGLYLCTTCGACEAVCPEDIATSREIVEMRSMVYGAEKEA